MKRVTETLFLPLIIILSFFFISCKKDRNLDSETIQIIENEIEVFETTSTPESLKSLYDSSEVLIFGETHYVQEHQEFIVHQLPQLHQAGYRIIFDELFHGFGWMVEDYLNDEIDELPEFLLFFHETIIEGVKQFNSNVEEDEKFRIVYMDMNHWTSNFLRIIEEIELILGSQSVFASIKNTTTDSSNYQSALQNLKSQIEEDNSNLIQIWGEKWYLRILEIIDGEIASSEYRINRSDSFREASMFDNIENFIQQNPNQKYLINTGFFHAQKETHMGNDIDRIAKMFVNTTHQTNAIVFVGMRGERKLRFNDEVNESFDLIEDASADDMIKELDKWAGNNLSFMPLTDAHFSSDDTKISYSPNSKVSAPISEQFDAIITYPTISTLISMDKYDWN